MNKNLQTLASTKVLNLCGVSELGHCGSGRLCGATLAVCERGAFCGAGIQLSRVRMQSTGPGSEGFDSN